MSNAASIARTLQGSPSGRGYLCRCPVPGHGKGRGDRTPSLSIEDGERALLVKCHAGCDTRDVLDELRRRGLIDGGPQRQQHVDHKPEAAERIDPNPDALALWRGAIPIDQTKAHEYLQARGITIAPPPSLRFMPAFEYIAGRIFFPAMVAGFEAGDRRLIATQVTMIDPRGDRKAQVRFPRKTFGRLGDGAVRLGAAGEVLGLAEGIETGLAATQMTGIPTWCALGGGRMASVAIPDCVRELHVFADNDEPGRIAAEKVARAHNRRRVIVRFPPAEFGDYADLARGGEALGQVGRDHPPNEYADLARVSQQIEVAA